MDFIKGLPKSKGRDAILILVDRLSKYAHFLPLLHPFSASQVAQLFFSEIIRLHGVPCKYCFELVVFGWKFFKLLGLELSRSFAYHL